MAMIVPLFVMPTALVSTKPDDAIRVFRSWMPPLVQSTARLPTVLVDAPTTSPAASLPNA